MKRQNIPAFIILTNQSLELSQISKSSDASRCHDHIMKIAYCHNHRTFICIPNWKVVATSDAFR